MFKKHLFLNIFWLFCVGQIIAQTPSYYHFSSADGLASSTVYDIIQDKEGFIWLATVNGISKFDGKHFSTFRTNEGLNSNSIISLLEGSEGELYIGNFDKGINVLKNGKIENYCDTINGKNIAISYLLMDLSKKGTQQIIAFNRWGGLSLIIENDKGQLNTEIISPYPIYINKLEPTLNGDFIALTTTGLYNYKNKAFSKMPIDGLPETNVLSLTNSKDGSFFIGTKGMIYQIKNKQVIKKYPVNIAGINEVNAILSDKNQNIWFSIMGRGFYMISNGTDKIVNIGKKLGLEQTQINKLFEDQEGNIWFCTYGKGVYYINNPYLKNLDENDGLINDNVYSIAKEHSGKLLFGTFNGVSILDNGHFNQIVYGSNESIHQYIYNIKTVDNAFFVCGALTTKNMINSSYQGIAIHLFDGLSFCKLRSGYYLFGTRGNSIKISKTLYPSLAQLSEIIIFGDNINAIRINQIFEDSEKNVWIGTGLGLCKAKIILNKDKKITLEKTFFKLNTVLNSKINAIIQDQNQGIWIASEKGIATYHLKNDSIESYTNLGAYDLSSSTSLAVDKKNRIWVGNMKGLYLVDGASIKYLNKQTGLPSNEIYSLLYEPAKNQLIVGSSGGISFLDIALFDKQIPKQLQVNIISIKAGDSVYTKYENLKFEPKQRDIIVNFKSLNFTSPGSIRYQYQLNANKWKETENDFLDFIALKNGTYQLQIKAKSQNGVWGKPTHISFVVNPRFSETLWFDFLVLTIITLIAISVVIWQSRVKQRKIRAELNLNERINTLKHEALSAMMNPHFIFNSLNSVQYLINCKRNEEANNYIAIMANLIRKNLDMAGSRFILLAEEIDRLKLYLNLEKLRLQEGFSYEIITATDVDTNHTMIPNMIIQPFLENALWHGIIDSGKKGLVSISFAFENVEIDTKICKSLIIKITDNGIGIIEAKKHKNQNHTSKGIAIIEERLSLLSEKMALPQPIMIDDLSKKNQNSHGTEVIISLPLPLYNIFD